MLAAPDHSWAIVSITTPYNTFVFSKGSGEPNFSAIEKDERNYGSRIRRYLGDAIYCVIAYHTVNGDWRYLTHHGSIPV